MKRTADDYDFLPPLQQFLLRPQIMLGTTAARERAVWVLGDDDAVTIERRDRPLSVALQKLVGEVFENAMDQRTHGATRVALELDAERGRVTVRNDGQTFVLQKKQVDGEMRYIPEGVFTHFGSGTNFRDSERARVGAGMNGMGLKCVTAMSRRVHIRLCDGRRIYEQTFEDNMSRVGRPEVRVLEEGEKRPVWSTTVTFEPDLARFAGVTSLETLEDVLRVNVRRCAAFHGGALRFFFNREAVVDSDSLAAYAKLHALEDGRNALVVDEGAKKTPLRFAWGLSRFDQAVQDSCVNGVDTWAGGSHVDAVYKVLEEHYLTLLAKRKPPLRVTRQMVRSCLHVVVFFNAESPSFTTQSKSELDSAVPTDAYKAAEAAFARRLKKNGGDVSGVVDALVTKANAAMAVRVNRELGGRRAALRLPGLHDADRLGVGATLIVCEGLSALTAAVAGIGVVGRTRYGATTTRGKILNVFGKSFEDAVKSDAIGKLVRAVGLRAGMTDVSKLRYDRVLLMTDQDDHGAHITGLLLCLFREYWPWFLREGRVSCLVTPIVKVRDRHGVEVASFFSEREFEARREELLSVPGRTLKYYKGLGTSTKAEQQAWFRNYDTHRKTFTMDDEGDEALRLFFDEKRADDRKNWINDANAARVVDYTRGTISVADFCGGPLRDFAIMQNRAMIADGMDGLKPVQRKVLFVARKKARSLKKGEELKVQNLAGALAEEAQYHHGAEAAADAIMLMGADYCNNLPLLRGIGAFGTRLGGKDEKKAAVGADAAAPRYVTVLPAPYFDRVVRPDDDAILRPVMIDGQAAEPRCYYPTLPVVLCNGTSGMGVGHSTDVPSFCPRRILAALRRRVRIATSRKDNGHDDAVDIAVPWTDVLGEPRFPGFTGTVERSGGGWRCHGKLQRSSTNPLDVRVAEIPFPTSFNAYDAFLKTLGEKGLVTGLRSAVEADPPFFEFTLAGELAAPSVSVADLHTKLKLSEYVPWKFKLWEGSRLVVYDGLDDFCERWYARKVASVRRRQVLEVTRRDAEIQEKALRVRFARAVIQKRIVVPSDDMVSATQRELGVDAAQARALLGRSLLSLNPETVERERNELREAREARDAYAAMTPEAIYARELEELDEDLARVEAVGGPGAGTVKRRKVE